MQYRKMGINVAWQQAQERLNRELKSLRVASSSRTPLSLLQEIRTLVDMQEREELAALVNRGQYRLRQDLQHLTLTESQWRMMTEEEKLNHFNIYLSSSPGKF